MAAFGFAIAAGGWWIVTTDGGDNAIVMEFEFYQIYIFLRFKHCVLHAQLCINKPDKKTQFGPPPDSVGVSGVKHASFKTLGLAGGNE